MTTTSNLSTVLAELAFTSRLSVAALERLAALAAPAQFRDGQELFREGSQNSNFYLIRSGRVALEMFVPLRGRVRILTLGAGEMLSWSSVVGHAMMTASAVTQGDVEAIVVSGPALDAACEEDHEFGYQIMRRLAESLAQRLLATRLQLLDLLGDHEPLAGIES